MTPTLFVDTLSELQFEGVFNPYRDRCDIHDLDDGPKMRKNNLRNYLQSIVDMGIDTIWMGRDLGYRGGRRTGLALTDEERLGLFARLYPGTLPVKATKGPVVAERTASEIWNVLLRLDLPPLLWNVFPFHPHEPGDQMTNRRFTAKELALVSGLNHQLISWLKIKKIICIGQDAAGYARSMGLEVECVRHPSYGGVSDFRSGMQRVYGNHLKDKINFQSTLFG